MTSPIELSISAWNYHLKPFAGYIGAANEIFIGIFAGRYFISEES